MREYGLRINLEQDEQAVARDEDFEGILKEDWLDAEDDIKCPIPNNSGGDIEVENPNENDSTAVADNVVQEIPKIGGSFELSELCLSQDYTTSAGVKKLLTTVPVGKPNRQRFFRVNPDPDYQRTVAVIELKEENET